MKDKEYKYMVGVHCFTFNQSKYILDALNGFVMQQTNFPYVVMVVDDASTDGEQEVIRKFVDEQFDTNDTSVAYEKETDYAIVTYAQHKVNRNCYIAVLYLKENHHSQRKTKIPYLSEWRDCTKYEALCEGDDYWIHPQKLQMQVDFLEENEEYGLVRTNVNRLNHENGIVEKDFFDESKIDNNFIDFILNAGWAAPCTWMYRKKLYDRFQFHQQEIIKRDGFPGDIALILSIAYNNNIKFLNKTTAVYRIFKLSSSHFATKKESIRFFKKVLITRRYFATIHSFDTRLKLEIKIMYKRIRTIIISIRRRFKLNR